MKKRNYLIVFLLIVSLLFFQYLWLLFFTMLLVILGVLVFDTRYDRYALGVLGLILLLYVCVKFMFYETYQLQSKSMLPTLNNKITVRGEKWRSGGIYLSAVEEWPLVTLFTRSSQYREGKVAARDRVKLFGFWKPRRNDILAYYAPVDSSEVYIDRCVALPGDVISIEEGRVSVNGVPREADRKLGLRYLAYFSDYIAFREACKKLSLFLNTDDFPIYEDAAYMCLDQATLERMRERHVADSIVFRQRGWKVENMFLAEAFGWDLRHWGPYEIPYKGMEIELTPDNLKRYGSLLRGPERAEGLEGRRSYVFQEDYYFMLGDNRGGLLDSRFWGPIPSCCIEARILRD